MVICDFKTASNSSEYWGFDATLKSLMGKGHGHVAALANSLCFIRKDVKIQVENGTVKVTKGPKGSKLELVLHPLVSVTLPDAAGLRKLEVTHIRMTSV